MCGIIGTYPQGDKTYVTQALEILKHRGSDSQGLVSTDKGTLGSTRLSKIGVENGKQPMRFGEAWIVFEEYYYYQIFKNMFGDQLAPNISGRTRSVTQNELQ